jgi:hypothetical protein
MRQAATKEIMFVSHSSKDDKGKRCILLIDNTTNIIYPTELGDPVLKVIGLTSMDIAKIKEFFNLKEGLF